MSVFQNDSGLVRDPLLLRQICQLLHDSFCQYMSKSVSPFGMKFTVSIYKECLHINGKMKGKVNFIKCSLWGSFFVIDDFNRKSVRSQAFNIEFTQLVSFFMFGPPKESIFFDHLLWSIYNGMLDPIMCRSGWHHCLSIHVLGL